jgi:hypothetical protein
MNSMPWCRQDLFFLEDSLRRGNPFAEVAGFLSRRSEVREKAESLGITQVRAAPAPKERLLLEAALEAAEGGAEAT